MVSPHSFWKPSKNADVRNAPFSLADRKKMAHKNSASFKRLKIKTKTLMNAGLARFLSRYV